MPSRLIGVLGIFVFLAVAYAFSQNRKAIRWKTVAMGMLLQVTFAVCLLGIPAFGIPGVFRFVFEFLNELVSGVIGFTSAGSQFLFGSLAEAKDPWGFIFAFRALPSIIFFSGLMAVLFHLGILQKVVKGVAWVMQKTMKTSGAETLSGAANIFVGQTEAPLIIKPYVASMTKSEIYCIMVGGMATIAAGVEAAYVSMLHSRIPEIAGHLLTASCMSAVTGLVVSKIIIPETGKPVTANFVKVPEVKADSNAIEALSRGASEGVQLAINVAAMLIAFIAMLALVDAGIAKLGIWFGISENLSFSIILGYLCRPFAWLLGVPWSEATFVGKLIGEKVMINEFVAYVHLAKDGALISDRSVIISSYALCGFANFSSIGIQLGGLGSIAPSQRPTLAKLGFLAVLGGTLATLMSAAVAGLLY
ncbi:MAG: nucleoside transporter C-terminal domain-containing protein [Bdellovibrionota bacterium]